VNVVRGWMEYGPRALCNTTTFALPYKKNVSRINFLNQRDEAMPMAPVLGRREAMRLFNHNELLEIPVSDRFMITTVGFQDNAAAASSSLNGVSHRDPLHRTYTARPQVVDDDDPIAKLLQILGEDCLINTSFNYHGRPIVYSVQDVIDTHKMQVARKGDMPITLIVVPS
jgi:carbamoyltransferase